MSNEDICSLCKDRFQDPVCLPCNHEVCRYCLECLVYRTLRKTTGVEKLPCPKCGKVVEICPWGVHFPTSEAPAAPTGPLCDICKYRKKPAYRFCRDCLALFCESCQSALHPPKAPLESHRVISVEAYQENYGPSKDNPDSDEAARPRTTCVEHKLPLTLFCGQCKALVCLSCKGKHDGHDLVEIGTAFERNKVILVEKAKEGRELLLSLRCHQSSFVDLRTMIEEVVDVNRGEIREIYERNLKALEAWQRNEVTKAEDKWSNAMTQTISLLPATIKRNKQLESLARESTNLASSDRILFLLKAEGLKERVESELTDITSYYHEKMREMKDVRSTLSADADRFIPPVPESNTPQSAPVDLELCAITVPWVTFLDEGVTGDEVDIQKGGSFVVCTSKSNNLSSSRILVKTSLTLTTAPQYWEIEVTWPCPDSLCVSPQTIGSVDLKKDGPYGPSVTSVRLKYSPCQKQHWYECTDAQKTNQSKMPNLAETMRVSTDRKVKLCFLFNYSNRELTVIENYSYTAFSVIHTFRNIEMSRGMFAVVMFYTRDASFRLTHPKKVAALPDPVKSILKDKLRHKHTGEYC